MAIWEDLVSDLGFLHGYQTVKRFVRKLRGGGDRPGLLLHHAISSDASREAGGPSCQRNNEHRAENRPKATA